MGPRLLVDAMPGAGKSVALLRLCEWTTELTGGRLRLMCAAMTGSAAAIVKGATIFTLLSVPIAELAKLGRLCARSRLGHL